MKRLPLFVSIAAVVALSASLAYWGLQLFKPPQRPIAPPPMLGPPEPGIAAAQGLFGGQIAVAQVSNYQLKGVVASVRGGGASAAILSADNKPAVALGVGREVAPGVTVKEVHPKYVLLSEGGVVKRVDLASDQGARSEGGMTPGMAPPANVQPPAAPQTAPAQPVQPPQNPPAQNPRPGAPAPGNDN
ncbi:type II secretion system protein N [Oxalobacteraceae bacterium A2-2]